MRLLLKFYKYAFAWENYLLLARAIGAAHLVRTHLTEAVPSPRLAPSLRAVERLYLPPQPGWRLTDPERVVRFASFVVNMPTAWGKCVQQSLIAYRLLNGYGYPAKICFGVNRDESNPENPEGHAWVVRLGEPDHAFVESFDPRERFKIVYSSPLPESQKRLSKNFEV